MMRKKTGKLTMKQIMTTIIDTKITKGQVERVDNIIKRKEESLEKEEV